MEIKCIAIDDEPLALEMIQREIKKVDYLDLIKTFHSVSEALKYLSQTTIDCIFLDIEMPDLNGMELSRIVNQFTNKPEIIFITAYNQYAIKENKLNSIGFLLKPFSSEDFNNMAKKVKKACFIKRNLADDLDPFFIKVEAQQVKIDPNQILYLESMGDYVKIFIEDKKRPLIPLITLKKIKIHLPNSSFIQINRSQIVNFKKINCYTASNLLIGEKYFTVSNTFRNEFEIIKKITL